MWWRFALAAIVFAKLMAAQSAQAQVLIESYTALLSEADHFNSSGMRLTTAAAIIRQDRANFHRFGLRDRIDDSDRYFADAGNRATLERLLERGQASPYVINRIVQTVVTIRVDIYRWRDGDFIRVTLLD